MLDLELTEKKIIKELGCFIVGSLQGFSFCPPKIYKLKKQRTWNKSYLHGIAWRNGKLGYDELFAVYYDIKVMNAEVSAEGLEKCRLVTRLLEQKVEKLNDYGCPKNQDLVGEGNADSSWSCSSCPFQHKARLHCGEQKCMENGPCNI